MSTVDWLLNSDPSIRWQVMRDLLDEPEVTVARERSRVAVDGVGSAPAGPAGGTTAIGAGQSFVPDAWVSTRDTLQLLRDLGVDPADDRMRTSDRPGARPLHVGLEFGDSPFFEGGGRALHQRASARGRRIFGEASDRLPRPVTSGQLSDGGWNCDARPASDRPSTRRSACSKDCWNTRRGKAARPDVTGARLRGQEYSFGGDYVRSRSTGAIILQDRKTEAAAWGRFSFPTRWHYDILWGLDCLDGQEPRRWTDRRGRQSRAAEAPRGRALAPRKPASGTGPFRDGRPRRIGEPLEHPFSAPRAPLGRRGLSESTISASGSTPPCRRRVRRSRSCRRPARPRWAC